MNLGKIVHLTLITILISYCAHIQSIEAGRNKTRELVDTVGFAQYGWQMDSIMARLNRLDWKKTDGNPWKLLICPHDDYTYTGRMYPEALSNIKASNLFLIGVAHKAAALGIEDSLVFAGFSDWRGPWGKVEVSSENGWLYRLLSKRYAIMNDSLQQVEHSLEALVPFLQYFNRTIKIIPLLVPAMSPERMEECGRALGEGIGAIAKKNKWEWGTDYAIIATTDAVHYGNEGWGGADRAYFGCDSPGNALAIDHEYEIIENCLKGETGPDKFRLFSGYTLMGENFREYKLPWCGRYSIPVALYTAYHLNSKSKIKGELIGYSTSINGIHLTVDDLRMGCTAVATPCHWVGYAAVGYR